jgi:hypothetical protein
MLGGSGVSSSLSMKIETFFLSYPPGCPLGCFACVGELVTSSDVAKFFTEGWLRPKAEDYLAYLNAGEGWLQPYKF